MKKEQLGELIIRSEDMLYHVAKTLLCNDADCADAIQEAIVKAFANLHKLREDSYARTWLTRILINECYGVMRREKGLFHWMNIIVKKQKNTKIIRIYTKRFVILHRKSEYVLRFIIWKDTVSGRRHSF